MSLYTNMMDDFALMERRREPDGAGGWLTSWQEGAQFKAALTLDSTLQAQIAEKQGVTSVYTVCAPRAVKFEYHDVIKRLADGATYRVTSMSGKETPESASIDMGTVSAERWELTT